MRVCKPDRTVSEKYLHDSLTQIFCPLPRLPPSTRHIQHDTAPSEHASPPPTPGRLHRSQQTHKQTRAMSTAVASAHAIGNSMINGRGLTVSRRVPSHGARVRPKRAAIRTMAFVPNMIPNPFHRWGACVVPTLSSEPRGRAPPVPRIDIVRGDLFSRAKAPKNRALNNTLI